MTSNEVKKELYKTKEMAKFSYYTYGKLYYKVIVDGGLYEFPISTVTLEQKRLSEGTILGYQLSDDLGITKFYSEIKGSELNRWIAKAIDAGEFIKIG
jgi:hypothetical protein